MSTKKIVPIKYTDRDFTSIKDSLVEYAKRYYEDTYKDFNEASFGSLMLDSVAYVGDILSFYLDFQANECFLDTALEYQNVVKLTKQMGYKYPGRPTAQGIASFYILCPANAAGTKPDADYMPILKKESSFSSIAGNKYMLAEDVDFSHSNNEIIVAKVNSITGIPVYYAVKAHGHIISGEMKTEFIDIGDYTKLRSVPLADGEGVSEILSVFDADGNEYYEVDYLSQDVVYKEFVNPTQSDKEDAPKIIKPVQVPRRFVVERELGKTSLQFGYGSESDNSSDQIMDPSNILLKMHGKKYISDESFDPYNFTTSDKLGVSPSNTTLEITYRSNTAGTTNAPVGAITQINDIETKFTNYFDLSRSKIADVRNSLEIINDVPILGDLQFVDAGALKARAQGAFYSQNRAVTSDDYKNLAYSMSPHFGSIKRCNIILDSDSFKRNLNMYTICENSAGKLVAPNNSIKQNLKTWISRYKMINDSIDILDARVLNLGVEFTIVTEDGFNKSEVLNNCLNEIETYFSKVPEIGESLSIIKIYSILNDIDGVIDAMHVTIDHKSGTNYADLRFNVKENMSADGRYVIIPKNVIYEIKFPESDIRGVVK